MVEEKTQELLFLPPKAKLEEEKDSK